CKRKTKCKENKGSCRQGRCKSYEKEIYEGCKGLRCRCCALDMVTTTVPVTTVTTTTPVTTTAPVQQRQREQHKSHLCTTGRNDEDLQSQRQRLIPGSTQAFPAAYRRVTQRIPLFVSAAMRMRYFWMLGFVTTAAALLLEAEEAQGKGVEEEVDLGPCEEAKGSCVPERNCSRIISGAECPEGSVCCTEEKITDTIETRAVCGSGHRVLSGLCLNDNCKCCAPQCKTMSSWFQKAARVPAFCVGTLTQECQGSGCMCQGRVCRARPPATGRSAAGDATGDAGRAAAREPMGAALAKDAGGKSVSFPVDVVAAIANVAYVMKFARGRLNARRTRVPADRAVARATRRKYTRVARAFAAGAALSTWGSTQAFPAAYRRVTQRIPLFVSAAMRMRYFWMLGFVTTAAALLLEAEEAQGKGVEEEVDLGPCEEAKGSCVPERNCSRIISGAECPEGNVCCKSYRLLSVC
ncbi:hypothetical protein C7M84_009906, partial [Penaeus vannamei]